ncbi:MAG: FAD-binding oxidoreductase [Gaiellaceae bacterium]
MDLRAALVEALGSEDRIATGESVLDQHAADLTYHPAHRPDAVVFAESREDVTQVLVLAQRERVPVVPFGAATSLEGHVIPVAGGISLDLTRLNRIEAVDAGDLTATVQAGVTRVQLNERLSRDGLQFSVDPGADATLGGMAATNASGTTTVRYGGMRAHVLALEVVLADGGVIRTGSRARKSSAGYDLTSLFVGSEGTLGVITELTVRVHGIPEHALAIRVAFPDLDAACETAVALVGAGVPVERLELLDGRTMAAVNAFKGTAYDEAPSLFVELAGTEAGIAGDLEATRELAEAATAFQVERDPTARARLWEARHHVFFALVAASPGRQRMTTDVCVPVSQLPDALRHARAAIEKRGLEAGIIAHAGDGNYHIGFMLDPADPSALERARSLNGEIVQWALAHGGTCTGEHGIGLGKRAFLEREHRDLLPLMRGIKALLDPHGILNPGKIFSLHGQGLANA